MSSILTGRPARIRSPGPTSVTPGKPDRKGRCTIRRVRRSQCFHDSGSAHLPVSRGVTRLGRSLALPIGVRTGILGRAKLLLSRNGLCRLGRSLALPEARNAVVSRGVTRLGRSLALPIGVRTGVLGRAKLLLSRNGLCRLGRSLALPEARKAVVSRGVTRLGRSLALPGARTAVSSLVRRHGSPGPDVIRSETREQRVAKLRQRSRQTLNLGPTRRGGDQAYRACCQSPL
jgi:hypothetical protein